MKTNRNAADTGTGSGGHATADFPGEERLLRETFRKGSKTYFHSSLFFPKDIRRNVFRLYGFVRVADNFVDADPQDAKGFHDFKARYRRALDAKKPCGDIIIDSFISLSREKGFHPKWADAFLKSMEMDLHKRKYHTPAAILKYIYGSAEIIGLFTAKLLGLPEASYRGAQLLGRAMQYINFIRDIPEDLSLGRTYLPLGGSGLVSLEESAARKNPGLFTKYIRKQIKLYRRWQTDAEKSFRFIPRRYRVPIRTASDMYRWTSETIRKDPFIVYRKKVKPSRARIIFTLLKNALTP